MNKEDIFLVADNDREHFELIKTNLLLAGIGNKMLHFVDGQELLDFLFDTDKTVKSEHKNKAYILLLDISIPKTDGAELLEKIKQNAELMKIPVIILTAVDDPEAIERCHNLGCSTYIIKPTENQDLAQTIQKIGLFLTVVETPRLTFKDSC